MYNNLIGIPVLSDVYITLREGVSKVDQPNLCTINLYFKRYLQCYNNKTLTVIAVYENNNFKWNSNTTNSNSYVNAVSYKLLSIDMDISTNMDCNKTYRY